MAYPDFLKEMSSRAVGYTLRDTAMCMQKVLENYITYPEFYHHIAEFQDIEMTQGQFFVESAHYDDFDQFICIIDGHLDMHVVPHVYRQEMMP